jgi:hypothetical protein
MQISILLGSPKIYPCSKNLQSTALYKITGERRGGYTVPSLPNKPMGGSFVFGLLTSANSLPAFHVPASRICARLKGAIAPPVLIPSTNRTYEKKGKLPQCFVNPRDETVDDGNCAGAPFNDHVAVRGKEWDDFDGRLAWEKGVCSICCNTLFHQIGS